MTDIGEANSVLGVAIPQGWEVTTVGQQYDIQLGKMLDAEKNRGDRKPYLGNRAVQWGQINVDDLPVMQMTKGDQNRYRLAIGDILVCEGGEVGRAAIWTAPIPEAYFQKALHRLRPKGDFHPKLLISLLDYLATGGRLSDYVTQTSIAHLTKEKFATVRLPMPPRHEQNAIAEALGEIDDLIASLDTLIAKKRDLKEATMQQLLTGRTRLQSAASKPMVQSELGHIPADWEVRTLSSLGEPVSGLTYKPTDVRAAGILVLRSSNVQDGELAFEDNVFVSPEVGGRALVAEGDILICVRNGSRALIGKCALIDAQAVGMAFGAFMTVFRSPHFAFLHHQFQSNTVQKQIHEHLGATINQITNASLRSFKVPFPKHEAERRAIAGVLSDMSSELRALSAKRFKLKCLREGMMQQLLTGRIRLQ